MSKWTNDTTNPAGKIQANRFNQAARDISSEHATTRTLSGIIGKNQNADGSYTPNAESSHSSMAMFSGKRREDVAKVQQEIGDKYNWTVSKDNVKDICDDMKAALPALMAARPTTDKRQTQEQYDAERAQMLKDTQERNQAQADKSANERAVCIAAYGSGETVTLRSGEVGIIAQLCYDNSHLQSDYFDSHARLGIPFLVGVLRGRSQTESEARRAIFGLAGLSQEQHGWSWKTEKYSMGHGNYLTGAGVEIPVEVGSLRSCYGGDNSPIKKGHWEIQFTTANYNSTDKHTFDTFKGYGERQQPETPSGGQGESAAGASGATVTKNEEHNGVEVRFEAKPSAEIISRLKSAGFRWSMRNRVWYKKFSTYAWQVASEIAGVTQGGQEKPLVDLQTKAMDNAEAGFTPDEFDMRVEDNMAAACGL